MCYLPGTASGGGNGAGRVQRHPAAPGRLAAATAGGGGGQLAGTARQTGEAAQRHLRSHRPTRLSYQSSVV